MTKLFALAATVSLFAIGAAYGSGVGPQSATPSTAAPYTGTMTHTEERVGTQTMTSLGVFTATATGTNQNVITGTYTHTRETPESRLVPLPNHRTGFLFGSGTMTGTIYRSSNNTPYSRQNGCNGDGRDCRVNPQVRVVGNSITRTQIDVMTGTLSNTVIAPGPAPARRITIEFDSAKPTPANGHGGQSAD